MSNSLQKGRNNQLSNFNLQSQMFSSVRKTVFDPLHYNARITRENPAAIVILLDQSGSMSKIVDKNNKLSEFVVNSVNEMLQTLLSRCLNGLSEELKDYFRILIIGYGRFNETGKTSVDYCWEGNLKGKNWVSVEDLRNNILEEEESLIEHTDRFGQKKERIIRRKKWFKAKAEGKTPMVEALNLCAKHLDDFVKFNPFSFPPLIFNITDGYPTDLEDLNELVEAANLIKSKSTNDGNSLLFNCLFSEDDVELICPNIAEIEQVIAKNEYHLCLANCSSSLPEVIVDKTIKLFDKRFLIDDDVKAVALNTSISSFVKFLNIGTITTLERLD